MHILWGDIFHVNIVYDGAVFQIKGHPGRCGQKGKFQFRMPGQFRGKAGGAGKLSARSLASSFYIYFPDPLDHFKQPGSSW